MKLIKQSSELLYVTQDAAKFIEQAGRTCYKSEAKITDSSADQFVQNLFKTGHHSVLEHAVASFRFVTNRGVTHELVRHRLVSYSQESTRYVRYGDCEFIEPVWWESSTAREKKLFVDACQASQDAYTLLLDEGWKPENAREVLPNALKTEIVMTTNFREWLHVFNLRCDKASHPQIRALMRIAKEQLAAEVPCLFDDMV